MTIEIYIFMVKRPFFIILEIEILGIVLSLKIRKSILYNTLDKK